MNGYLSGVDFPLDEVVGYIIRKDTLRDGEILHLVERRGILHQIFGRFALNHLYNLEVVGECARRDATVHHRRHPLEHRLERRHGVYHVAVDAVAATVHQRLNP